MRSMVHGTEELALEAVDVISAAVARSRTMTGAELGPGVVLFTADGRVLTLPVDESVEGSLPGICAQNFVLFAIVVLEAWVRTSLGGTGFVSTMSALQAGMDISELDGSREAVILSLEHPLMARVWSCPIEGGVVGDKQMLEGMNIFGMKHLTGLAPGGPLAERLVQAHLSQDLQKDMIDGLRRAVHWMSQ